MELKDIVKSITKKYDMEGIARIGVLNEKFKSTFSLGTPGLDFCTYNAIPEGVFVEVSGAESSGKTTLAFLMASDFIRKEKKKAVEDRRHILFVDAEGTVDPQWALTSTGYDMNDEEVQTIYLTPLGQSAEQIFDMVIESVKSGKIGLVIFDSLVAIAAQQTNEESLEKKDMGVIAKVMADFVRRSTGLFNRFRTTFIGINGIIMNIGGYGNPETVGGGTYWKRACSLRIKVKRGAYFDEDGNELKTTAESPAGHVIEMAILKTKFCRWDRKLGRCHLHYTKGIDILWDTIEVAQHFNIIQSPSQGWFNIYDPDTGEIILDDEGKEIKIRGQKNLKPYFEEHKDLWRRVYDSVYKQLSIKENPNVVSFEKMLGLDVGQEFGIDLDKEILD